jgi:xanthine dehydrogenase YagS FAD-binding subunit
MIEFRYEKAKDAASAIQMFASGDRAHYLAGGTNLVDLMRENIERPETVIDVTGLSQTIEARESGGILIGAAVKNTALAADLGVRKRFPVLARAILADPLSLFLR